LQRARADPLPEHQNSSWGSKFLATRQTMVYVMMMY
jgi:hypothetical protein